MTSQRLACRLVAVIGIGAGVLAAPAFAQDCPEFVGRWPAWGIETEDITAVALSDGYAYVAGDALSVIDVSTPSTPVEVGFVDTPGEANAVAVEGGYAYVAARSAGLLVIDVSVATTPVLAAGSGTPGGGDTSDVAVDGDFAYVAVVDYEYGGLHVVDVSTPSAPVEVGFADTPGSAYGVAVTGGYAYVAYHDGDSGLGGLRVVDVSTPSAPVEVGSFDRLNDRALRVEVSGGYAYVTYNPDFFGEGRLRVIDVSVPSSPVEVSIIDTPGSVKGAAVSGSYAYVADGDSGLRVIDVSTPSAPVEVASLETRWAQGVAVSGGYAYVVGGGLGVIDVSTPSAPVEIVFVGARGAVVAWGVAAAGGYAYIAGSGFWVIDVSTPSAPVEVGFLSTSGTAVALSGGYAYVLIPGWEGHCTLSVIDVSTHSAPVWAGTVGTQDFASAVAVSGSYAYVVGASGLSVIDVGTPSEPVEVGYLVTPEQAVGIAVSGSYAYVADGDSGLRVIDVSTPSAPVEVGFLDIVEYATHVAVSGGYAYVTWVDWNGEGGLSLIDVSTPSAPVEVGLVDTLDWATGVTVDGDNGYVISTDFEDHSWLHVIDVSTPSAPAEVGFADTPGEARSVAVEGGHAFVATGGTGMYVYTDCVEVPQPDARECFIPAAAVAAGAQGAFFQTDVEINNKGAEEAQVSFQWLPRGEDNSEPVESEAIDLAPGQSLRYENVLTEVFNLEPDSLGALMIVASTESVIGMSRTYNIPGSKAAGTFGQGLPAIRATEMIQGTEPQRIIFLSEDPDSRANVGCVNGSSEPVTISIGLFNAEGEPLETKTMDLGPRSNNQINRVFEDYAPINGYVDVWADSDEALYYCYGSMLDNLTSDPTTVLPQTTSGATLFIPAVALAAGLEGSFFTTDVDLNNVDSTDLTYDLAWLPRGEDNREPVRSGPFLLGPGAGVRYTNVLGELFGLEPDQIGALELGANGPDLLAMSRTYNLPSAKVAGTFGQELPGIPADQLIPTGVKKRIIFMNENDDVRSNVGCQNAGLDPVTVKIELHNAGGERLGTRTMDLPPLSNDQATRVFRNHAPISAGYVDVWTDTEGASIYCYGSVLDNLTSDPTTVLPQ